MAAHWYVMTAVDGRFYCHPNRVELALHVAALNRRLGFDGPLRPITLDRDPWTYARPIAGLPSPYYRTESHRPEDIAR